MFREVWSLSFRPLKITCTYTDLRICISMIDKRKSIMNPHKKIHAFNKQDKCIQLILVLIFACCTEISQETAVNPVDIVSTLQSLQMLKYWKGKHLVLKRQVSWLLSILFMLVFIYWNNCFCIKLFWLLRSFTCLFLIFWLILEVKFYVNAVKHVLYQALLSISILLEKLDVIT